MPLYEPINTVFFHKMLFMREVPGFSMLYNGNYSRMLSPKTCSAGLTSSLWRLRDSFELLYVSFLNQQVRGVIEWTDLRTLEYIIQAFEFKPLSEAIYLRPPGRIKNQPTNKNNNLKEKNIHIAKLKLAKHAGCAHGGGLLLKDICWLHSLGRPGGEEPGSETCKEIETRRWLLKEHGTRTLAASHSEHEGVKMPPLCFTQLREPEIQSKAFTSGPLLPRHTNIRHYSFFSLPL